MSVKRVICDKMEERCSRLVTLLERTGVWCSVPVHVDRDAPQWNGRRSAAEEENLVDNERQKAGKWCR